MTVTIQLTCEEALEILHHKKAVSESLNGINQRLDEVLQKCNTIIDKELQIMATQAEFQAKIDQINANTTASAQAASSAAAAGEVIKSTLAALREQVAGMGLSAEQEASIFANLDAAVAGTDAVKSANESLKSFLESTAAGPVTEPEPDPVPPVEVPPAEEPTPEP